ncbi:MAG: response regulator, partial [Desulfonatronovibrio sp.]
KIYLPATDQIDAVKAEKAPQNNVSLEGTETILMVDDYDDIRDLSSEVLEDSGYRVMSAASGEKALEIFKENPQQIDLVIMDLNMPGMGGRECTRQMLSIDPSVKVLVASGYSAMGHNKEASELGAKGFLSKPYQTKELLVRIRKLLDGDEQ